MSRYSYAIISLLALSLVLLLVFFVPEKESENSKTPAWDKVWEKIEYYSGEGDSPAARFLRQPGFFEDRYYIESPAGGEAGKPYVRRRASSRVKNLFADWRKPELKAIYLDDQKSLRKAELESSQERIEFYSEIDSEPVVLKVGSDRSTVGQFVQSSFHNDMVLVLPDYMVERFRKNYLHFRDQKIVRMPSGTHIERIRIDRRGQKPLEMVQRYYQPEQAPKSSSKKKQKKDRAKPRLEWFSSNQSSEKKLSKSIVTRLVEQIKRLRIEHFQDEGKVEEYASAEELWQKAGEDYIHIEVNLNRGNSYSIAIRQPTEEVAWEGKQLWLLRSSNDDFTDYVGMDKATRIEKQADRVAKLMEVKAKTPVPKATPKATPKAAPKEEPKTAPKEAPPSDP